MTTPILEVHGASKRFGRHEVLRGVDLAVHPAEHVALIGNNGQGKTTLLRVILGLLPPEGGTLRLGGEAVGFPRATAAKRNVGYLPESVSFYPHLSARQTLRFLGNLKRAGGGGGALPLREEVDTLLGRVGLSEAADRKVRHYSKGMRQRLGLAAALLGNPRLLLLDEPTNGLDPEGVHEFYDILAALQQEGVAILMASHLLSEIEPRLNRLAVLRDGVISTSGSIAELTAEARLPITVRFSLSERVTALPVELLRLGAEPTANGHARAFVIRAEEGARFRVLSELVRHAQAIDSLVVREPGLEELFHRLNQSAEPADAAREARP